MIRTTRLSTAPYLLLGFMVLLLSACKIEVVVPAGGKVVSEGGVECLSGDTCIIEVSDETYDDTFRAIPNPGYIFKHWKKGGDNFCGKKKGPCRLLTTIFDGNQGFLDILASDKSYFLKPVFVNKSGYKLSYWSKTLSEIEEGSFASDSFLYDIQPNVSQCDPGALSEKARQRALQAVNQIRGLHKLPAVDYDSFYDMEVQEASLVQRANNYINHVPASSDACYTASAETGSMTSNLAAASQQVDPASDVFGWTNDNFNVAALEEAGHRRWILFPELGYASYGQVEGFSALKVFGFGQQPQKEVSPKVKYIAFPYKTYPWVLVSQGDNPTPWSISMVPSAGMSSEFDYFSDAGVKVKNIASGKALPVHTISSDTKGFGLANFLSWQLDNWDYDTAYKVTISGITLPDGGTQKISYEVLLDRYSLIDIERALESGDGLAGSTMQGMFHSPVDEDSYRVSLAGTLSFTGSSEFSNQGFFIHIYDNRKRLIKSADTAFNMDFSPGSYTVLISPCDVDGICYQNVKNYTVSFE